MVRLLLHVLCNKGFFFFIIEEILHCIRATVGVYLEKEEEDNEKNIPTDDKRSFGSCKKQRIRSYR